MILARIRKIFCHQIALREKVIEVQFEFSIDLHLISGVYTCPCYYYPNRTGDSGRPSFVVAVDLKSGAMSADHWVKRGTALLMSLDE